MAISHRASITETSAEVPAKASEAWSTARSASSTRPDAASARAYAMNVDARSATEIGTATWSFERLVRTS